MAGFGGFGGLGSSFPMRFGSPESQRILSDQEFNTGWQNKISAEASARADATKNLGQQYAASSVFQGGDRPTVYNDAAVNSFVKSANNSVNGGLADRSNTGQNQTQFNRTLGNLGLDGAYSQMQPDMSQQLQQQYALEKQQREQGQVAQQQAYNGMIGNGQLNGILGADYTTPGFGQINGQTTNPYAINNAPAGVNMDWTKAAGTAQNTGVYDPLAATQKTFWGI